MADTSLIRTFEDFREEFEAFRIAHKKETQDLQTRLRSSQGQCRHVLQSLQHGRDEQKSVAEGLDMLELFIEAGHSCPILQKKLYQHKNGMTSCTDVTTDEGAASSDEDEGIDTSATVKSDLSIEAAEVEGSRVPAAVHERLQFVRKTAKEAEQKAARRQKSKSRAFRSSRGRKSNLEDVEESNEEVSYEEKAEGNFKSYAGELAHDEWKPIGKLIKKEDRAAERVSPKQENSKKKELERGQRGKYLPEKQNYILDNNPILEPSILESPSKDNWSFEPMCEGMPLPSFSDDGAKGAFEELKNSDVKGSS